MFLAKGVLKICSKFTAENPCQRVTSVAFKFLNLWKPEAKKHRQPRLERLESIFFAYSTLTVQKQPSTGVLIKRCSENMQQIYRRTPMPKCDFNKVAKQLYRNHTSAWVFPYKFAAYFQNTFCNCNFVTAFQLY